jgi:hypothetical protein
MFINDGGLQHTQSELVDGILRQVRWTIPNVHQFSDHLGINSLSVLQINHKAIIAEIV